MSMLAIVTIVFASPADGDTSSGSPLLVQVNQATGEGTVAGVIGGYQQGGDSPSVSYSIAFGSNVGTLYQSAAAAS